MSTTQRYLIFFSYIGSSFRGSQVQISSEYETVQYVLEGGFKKVFKADGERPFKVHLASRTDAGVHAMRAALYVDLPIYRNRFLLPEAVKGLMNSHLDNFRDVRVTEVYTVPDTFNFKQSCLDKTYLYRIGVLKTEFCSEKIKNITPIVELGRTQFIKSTKEFDINKAKEATYLFEGRKDFGAILGKPTRNVRPTICNILSYTVEKGQPLMPIDPIAQKYDYYNLICKGDRFLFHMVRRMVALTMGVGFGSITLADIKKLFDEPVPSSWPRGYVPVVPGCGLYLVNTSIDLQQLNQEDKLLENADEKTDSDSVKREMSFLEELVKKKEELKSCQTVITSLAGNKFVEHKNVSGMVEIRKLSEKCSGFVVDKKLDLQIAEILEYLYLSSQDVAQDFDLLKKNGITHVLSLGVELPNIDTSYKIIFKQVELLDEPTADISGVLASCSEFIENARRESISNKVLVHCNAGYSRAPSIVIGYLMTNHGYSLDESYNMVKQKRNIKPNDGFMKQLVKLEEKLKKLKSLLK